MKQPITLEQAIQIAFQNNPNIQATLSLVEKSKESVAEMKAHFNPTVSAQATQTQQKSSSMTPGSATRASVTVTMPIDISKQAQIFIRDCYGAVSGSISGDGNSF